MTTKIISGFASGAVLSVPQKGVRPTSSMVRQAIFSSLSTLVDFTTSQVLDLYAGAGSLGIEAVSRGAREITFVDSSSQSIECIKANLQKVLKIQEAQNPQNSQNQINLKIIKKDINAFFDSHTQDSKLIDVRKFKIIFADPPYTQTDEKRTQLIQKALSLLHDGGIFILELDKRSNIDQRFAQSILKRKTYGDTQIIFFVN